MNFRKEFFFCPEDSGNRRFRFPEDVMCLRGGAHSGMSGTVRCRRRIFNQECALPIPADSEFGVPPPDFQGRVKSTGQPG
jgi:hypothetical protein